MMDILAIPLLPLAGAFAADAGGFALVAWLISRLLGKRAVTGAASAVAAKIAPTMVGKGIKRFAIRAAGEEAEEGVKRGLLGSIRAGIPTTPGAFGGKAARALTLAGGTIGSFTAGGLAFGAFGGFDALDGRSDVDRLGQFSANNADGADSLNTQAVMDTVRSEEEIRAMLREFVGSDDAVEDLLAAFSNPGTPMPRII